MKVAQIIPYVYLVLAVLFIYDAVDKYLTDQNYILSVAFAAVGIFMFFFRLRFLKKLKEEQQQGSKNK
ncbi:hypothetical protein K5I29_12920 [Flavobacterium agricola]|uniref:Uncharacterized protein n=1 Tax=Flavobacterium agricola TaxID=2870839 RepID=A0ABY6M265_9FLAO|nr:hypothetical protein K5I29_12920 [Flavobacterium agricola]